MRVALIYDDTVRPDTTGVHCREALEGLAEVIHFLPRDIAQIPAVGFDLYLNIDDGLRYSLPAHLRPSAWWVIDTHLSYEWDLRKAGDFDLVFAAQQDGAERLRQDGILCARWLPLACNPRHHRRHEVEKQHDVCFVGNIVHGERERLIRLIQERFPSTFVGRAFWEEMARLFSASRLVFNRSIVNDVNMRVFEAVACGSLLITNDLAENGQDELLTPGEHLVTYRSDDELIERIRYYLDHEEEREAIAQRGMERAHAEHTYAHRMQTILDAVGEAGAAGTLEPGASPYYFQFPRPDLIALIPQGARRILDVGCGAGRMGEALKAARDCTVVGIEADPEVAKEAEQRLDAVIVGDVESDGLELGEEPFDCIVFGDVLEHLRDPKAAMDRLMPALAPDGTVVLSVPNVRNCQVIRDLALGFFSYEPAGILDESHLRFFALGELLDLLARSGLDPVTVRPVFDPQVASWRSVGRPTAVKLGWAELSMPSPEEAEELFVYQYLISARRKPVRPPRLASIIILCWNELEYTKQCIESVLANTSAPFELVLVDNGSTDGTPDYMATIDGAKVIRNEENLGFPKGVNQGIEAAEGDYIVLLNNDTIVPPGWLDRLTQCAESAEDIGMVGPRSNYVVGDQLIAVPYLAPHQIPAFAAKYAWQHRGERQETHRLIGFCMLIRREALNAVGLLDEEFGIGTFEDDDLCWRVRQAGYRLVIAGDAFVHHFGSRTFIGQRVDTEALLDANKDRFLSKHGIGQVAQRPTDGEADGPRISLCMIVRDEEANLANCLASIRPWVDEMVVVDTGSKDRTPEIARQMGARVEHFEWCDSFSGARNESLKHATGDWIFWMDADDVVDEANGRRLRELVSGAGPGVGAFTVRVHCPPRPGEDAGMEVVDHVKLFRNDPRIRFEFHIHEQILPSIRRTGGEVVYTDAFVTHAGYDTSAEGQRRKRERDLRLLQLDLADHPEHPFVHFNVGMTAYYLGDLDKAAHHLERSLALAGPDESHVRKAYALLCGCHRRREDWASARCVAERGLDVCPRDPELLFNMGIILHQQGDLPGAARAYEAILEGSSDAYLRSVDVGIGGFKARHNLALVYQEMGDTEAAIEELQRALAEAPAFEPSQRALAGLLGQGE